MSTNLNRRKFVVQSLALASTPYLGSCSLGATRHTEANETLRRPLPEDSNIRELVRYATLAANGHNTQPWKFKIGASTVDILPDFTRRTSVVDPDDHHLYASLGCAAENLTIAAQARGQSGEVAYEPSGDGSIIVDLTPTQLQESLLFQAIPQRQCTRSAYEGNSAPSDVLDRLQSVSSSYGVEAIIITEDQKKEEILSLVVEGNSNQMDDPAFVKELKDWLRFNGKAAAETGDGLYSACSGNPTTPDWLGSALFSVFFKKDKENEKYAEHIRSSAGLIAFVSKSDDKEGWINAGRAYERFALQSTVDGLKHAFVNQALEDRPTRHSLQSILGIGDQRPNLLVRFGYGAQLPYSLRRPVEQVLV